MTNYFIEMICLKKLALPMHYSFIKICYIVAAISSI